MGVEDLRRDCFGHVSGRCPWNDCHRCQILRFDHCQQRRPAGYCANDHQPSIEVQKQWSSCGLGGVALAWMGFHRGVVSHPNIPLLTVPD